MSAESLSLAQLQTNAIRLHAAREEASRLAARAESELAKGQWYAKVAAAVCADLPLGLGSCARFDVPRHADHELLLFLPHFVPIFVYTLPPPTIGGPLELRYKLVGTAIGPLSWILPQAVNDEPNT